MRDHPSKASASQLFLTLTGTEESRRAGADPDHAEDGPLDNVALAPLLLGLIFPEGSVELILACILYAATGGAATR